jgi:hypothetical protein
MALSIHLPRTEFFSLANPFSRTVALRSTQSLTGMSARNLRGEEGRPVRKAENLTASVSRLSINCGSLNVSQLYGLSLPNTITALPIINGKRIVLQFGA